MKKSQCLFLVIGGSALPNFISGCSRLQRGGTIVFLHSGKTLDNAKRLEKVICRKYEGNVVTKFIQISAENDVEIIEELQKTTAEFFEMFDCIEIDYTCGTKAMSAGCFYFFRKKAFELKEKKIILSYLDNERDKMYYEIIKNGKSKLENEFLKELKFSSGISISEIFEINSKKLDLDYNVVPIHYELGERIVNRFVDCSEDEYNENINLLEKISLEVKSILDKAKGKKEKEKIIKEKFALVDKEKYRGILKGEEINSRLLESLNGFWFEDYVLKILQDIKEKNKENIIEVINSAKNTVGNKFEIDFVILKKYSPILVSVTTQEEPSEAVYKLFEVVTRAKRLNAYKSCFISLCPNSKKLEKAYANVWERENLRSTLIIGVDRLKTMYSRLEKFIVT